MENMIRVDVFEDAVGAENPTFAGISFSYSNVDDALIMVETCLLQGKYVVIDPVWSGGNE